MELGGSPIARQSVAGGDLTPTEVAFLLVCQKPSTHPSTSRAIDSDDE